MGRYGICVKAVIYFQILQTIPRGVGPIFQLRSSDERRGVDFNHFELCAAGRIYL